MQSSKSVLRVVCLVTVAAMLSAVAASAASASPVWEFNGTVLVGSEAVSGSALSSSFTIPGATTSCANVQLLMKIVNVAGAGKGEVIEFPLSGCTAGPSCTVNSIEAERLPWPAHAVTVAGKNYVVIEKIQIGILYGGALCALAGSPVTIKGTAGGLYENSTSTLIFNKASFTATGTALKVGASAIEWDAIFPMEAFGAHSGEALEIS
ncbi:MAG TPA: hypothetical protein VGL57_02995 [Solirubrobacteraceae bacterium]|jgi:hypothetical protein